MQNFGLLNVALTHTSYANEHKNEVIHDNERLEFLGEMCIRDSPNTVSKGISSVARLGAGLITVHASGGRRMIEEAAEAARKAERNGKRPKILAVTVLTSFDEKLWKETGETIAIEDKVLRLALSLIHI